MEIFSDTSSLVGVSTGLDRLTRDTQAALAEQYGEVWAVGNEGHQESALERLSRDTERSQESPENKEGDDETEEMMKMKKMKKTKRLK